MVSSSPPEVFNRAQVRRLRERSVINYPKYNFLKTRATEELLERLEDTPRRFPIALDLGCHTGIAAKALKQSKKADFILAADLSEAMSRASKFPCIAADEERLPLKESVMDLIVSLLSLHTTNDLPGVLVQIRRALKPDGLFMGCLFGAGTLKELRESLMQAEVEHTGGAAQRVAPLPGLQDMAGLLQRAGLALPDPEPDRHPGPGQHGTG